MNRSSTLESRLAQKAAVVEQALDVLLPAAPAFPAMIHEAMRYSTLGGGKRLRGVLVMEAGLVCGGSDAFERDVSVPSSVHLRPESLRHVGPLRAAAAAVEMVHAYSLIHDDLPCMDDDDVRRGKATNHRVFGEAMAVLAGDALLTRAFEVLSRLSWAGVDDQVAVGVIAELATAGGTGGLIGGQVVDLQSEGQAGLSEESDAARRLEYIHAHKTGALFRASMRMGARLAGADEQALKRLDAYARHFGLAFQIVDDLLDVEGDAPTLGKEVGSDARKGKLTFPALYGVDTARRMAKTQIDEALKALVPFGDRAGFLAELAEFVLHRQS